MAYFVRLGSHWNRVLEDPLSPRFSGGSGGFAPRRPVWGVGGLPSPRRSSRVYLVFFSFVFFSFPVFAQYWAPQDVIDLKENVSDIEGYLYDLYYEVREDFTVLFPRLDDIKDASEGTLAAANSISDDVYAIQYLVRDIRNGRLFPNSFYSPYDNVSLINNLGDVFTMQGRFFRDTKNALVKGTNSVISVLEGMSSKLDDLINRRSTTFDTSMMTNLFLSLTARVDDSSNWPTEYMVWELEEDPYGFIDLYGFWRIPYLMSSLYFPKFSNNDQPPNYNQDAVNSYLNMYGVNHWQNQNSVTKSYYALYGTATLTQAFTNYLGLADADTPYTVQGTNVSLTAKFAGSISSLAKNAQGNFGLEVPSEYSEFTTNALTEVQNKQMADAVEEVESSANQNALRSSVQHINRQIQTISSTAEIDRSNAPDLVIPVLALFTAPGTDGDGVLVSDEINMSAYARDFGFRQKFLPFFDYMLWAFKLSVSLYAAIRMLGVLLPAVAVQRQVNSGSWDTYDG